MTFEYKDYRDHGGHKTTDGEIDRCAYTEKEITLSVEEFIRRFALHIPPKRFRRVRFYGFLGRNQKECLERMKKLTNTPDVVHAAHPDSESHNDEEETTREDDRCKKCQGLMKSVWTSK